MHKVFYASGFLYHPATAQILLQQSFPESPWSLFDGISLKGETIESAFKRIIHEHLHIKLVPGAIQSVYIYSPRNQSKDQAIAYAEIEDMTQFSSKPNGKYAWFTFKQILKLSLSEQVKHDITVGQRVIDAKVRKHLGLRTLE